MTELNKQALLRQMLDEVLALVVLLAAWLGRHQLNGWWVAAIVLSLIGLFIDYLRHGAAKKR
ncbi:hypothetical protein [Lacticaseibacillus parakribbianus]|uniref:hypothetical protein n=1 Tax=Lacticaseibacillus parakribbianus TaxID=2970927 RepID=UPI0021CB5770|nr:hypothetical protein [Lacticaseibacillus parakribbianus]